MLLPRVGINRRYECIGLARLQIDGTLATFRRLKARASLRRRPYDPAEAIEDFAASRDGDAISSAAVLACRFNRLPLRRAPAPGSFCRMSLAGTQVVQGNPDQLRVKLPTGAQMLQFGQSGERRRTVHRTIHLDALEDIPQLRCTPFRIPSTPELRKVPVYL